PALYIDNQTVLEGDSGQHTARFHLRLSQATTSNVTVKVSTANSTATGGEDFVALPSTNVVTIPVGQTEVPVDVTINGDTYGESTETFSVKLATASTNAAIGDSAGTGTIIDEEG